MLLVGIAMPDEIQTSKNIQVDTTPQEDAETCLYNAYTKYTATWNRTCQKQGSLTPQCEELLFADNSLVHYLLEQPEFNEIAPDEPVSEFIYAHKKDFLNTLDDCTCELSGEIVERLDKIHSENKQACYR